MKSFDPNDPRITAYALGELHGAERDAFERELADSEELQRELESINHFTDMIKDTPTEHGLEADQRADLVARCDANLEAEEARRDRQRTTIRWVAIGGGIAACFALLASLMIPSVTSALSRPTPGQMAEMRKEMDSQTRTRPQLADNRRDAEVSSANKSRGEGKLDVGSLEFAEYEMPADQLAVADDVATPSSKYRPLSEYVDEKARTIAMLSAAPATPTAAPMEETTLLADSSRGRAARQNTAISRFLGGKGHSVGSGTGIRVGEKFNTEAYDAITENGYHVVTDEPLSTFSIDVDTASYSNVRRFLRDDQRPPSGAIRIEEMINYFPYSYAQPEGGAPFSVTTDVTRAPWNPSHLLARVGLQGREIAADSLPPSNLVFLIDVSGSMKSSNKLPLLQRSLVKLVDELRDGDRVAIVTYAGASGLELPSTDASDKMTVRDAIERLGAGGSTNGAAGIQLAYETARAHFLEEGNNRVILCTDGDFNVGTTSRSSLTELIESERESGVFLSVLSFGTGNLKDSAMEQLADKGNGNYAYIDTPAEGEKVLVEQMGGTLFTIAKDVKIQVEFNPATVAGYRLIGYENRILAKEDFNDDTKDAGEIGAGHSVTALYEIVPAGGRLPGVASVDPLKYQTPAPGAEAAPVSGDLFTVKLRYKAPDGDVSQLIERPVGPEVVAFDEAPEDLRFATAVAAFGMRLRGSENAGDLGWDDIQRIARGAMGEDPGSYRAEFLTLVERAKKLD